MRQLYAYDANESTRRLPEDRMSMGLINTHMAWGFSVLYHVFARKQCILCSALRHKSYLTLSLYVTSIRELGTSWNFRARRFVRLCLAFREAARSQLLQNRICIQWKRRRVNQ